MAAPTVTRPVVPTWALAAILVAVMAVVLAGLALVGGDALPDRQGPPVEQLAVERTVLEPGTIELRLRNTGPDAVSVAQIFVNDAYAGWWGRWRDCHSPGPAQDRFDRRQRIRLDR